MGLKPGRDGVLKLTNLTVQEEETGGFHGYSLLLGHETEVRFHRFEPSDVPNSKATILELREKYGERKFTEQWQKKKNRFCSVRFSNRKPNRRFFRQLPKIYTSSNNLLWRVVHLTRHPE